MKGDYSRDTHDREHPRSSVRLQQGRVSVDADWNELVDIQDDLRETALRDVIGRCGVPADEPHGFEVVAAGTGLSVRGGRIWVDGILCRGEAIAVDAESLKPFRTSGLPALVYLEVWQRHLTAVEEPDIREPALGGPDTATRTRTVCRVRVAPLDEQVRCQSVPDDWRPEGETSGKLAARAQPPATSADPCPVPAQAGYTGLGNQLYRVEIHDVGATADGTATFKWSIDNGSVLTELDDVSVSDRVMTVRSLGRDKVRGLHDVERVEIGGDALDLQGEPGPLVEIDEVAPAADGRGLLTAAPGTILPALASLGGHPKVRRWDGGPQRIDAGSWQPLGEHHVEVRFTPGTYRAGDYWLIPARAFIGDQLGTLLWPSTGAQPAEVAPHGVRRHYCRLAVVRWGSRTDPNLDAKASAIGIPAPQFVVEDCRLIFPPLTRLLRFLAIGGQGQQGPGGSILPCPLRVAVVNDLRPVEGARVRFHTRGNGTVLAVDPSGTTVEGPVVETSTGSDGIASCQWRLPETAKKQPCVDIRADLVKVGDRGVSTVPCFFNASTEERAAVRVEKVVIADKRRRPLPNDGFVDLDSLLRGIELECNEVIEDGFLADDPPDGDRRSARPLCDVTLYLPVPNFWDIPGAGGHIPVRLLAAIEAKGKFIRWHLRREAEAWLRTLLVERKLESPLLAELRVRGNFIWSGKGSQAAADGRHLDGELFGKWEPGPRVGVELPSSGDRRPGGELYLWFWLVAEPFFVAFELGFGAIAGELLQWDDKPIASAEVVALRKGKTVATTTTLPDGSYKLTELPGGRMTIEFKHPTLGVVSRNVAVPDPGSLEVDAGKPLAAAARSTPRPARSRKRK